MKSKNKIEKAMMGPMRGGNVRYPANSVPAQVAFGGPIRRPNVRPPNRNVITGGPIGRNTNPFKSGTGDYYTNDNLVTETNATSSKPYKGGSKKKS